MDAFDRILKQIEYEKDFMKKTALDILYEVVESTASISDDAERIKTILLHRHHCGHFAHLNKYEIAYEWGKMEEVLHLESFWTFVNPAPKTQRYAKHRMNYVIEMLLRCEKDKNGDFVDVSTLLRHNPHYLFERCLPIMLNMEADEIPFLQCDYSLMYLKEDEPLCPTALHEISPGMLALWIAIKLVFKRLLSWYTFLVLDLGCGEECRETNVNNVRDSIMAIREAEEEDLIPTGKTLGEFWEEETS